LEDQAVTAVFVADDQMALGVLRSRLSRADTQSTAGRR
jgi:DNA-binding LacI/PurR family transcriptional regulator